MNGDERCGGRGKRTVDSVEGKTVDLEIADEGD